MTTRRLSSMLLLCAAVAGLSSCRLMRKNYNVMADRVTPAQSDEVMVESRGALPPIAPAAVAQSTPPPHALPPAAAPGSGRTITVQRGDTLSGLARRHNTSVSALCAVNNIRPNTPIKIGQQLRLPTGSSHAAAPRTAPATARKSTPPRTYIVKRGDSISRIAAKHGVSTAALLRANGMTPRQADRIREGQKLHIPAK